MAIVFALPSGCPAGAAEIQNFVVGAAADAQVLGFFGSAGPGNSISVGSYQDSTYRTTDGGADQGRGINVKYIDANNVSIDGADNSALPVAAGSGTMTISLSGVSSVQTQNAALYSFQMDASSGVQQATAADNMTVQMCEINIDSAWTDVSSDGSNSVSFNNHTTAATRHDFYPGISARPNTTGTKKLWGFFFSVEYF